MITLIKTVTEADNFICNEVLKDLNDPTPLNYLNYVKSIINSMQYDTTIDLSSRHRLKNEDFFYKCLTAIIVCYPELKLTLSSDLKQLRLEK